jgi:pSer/pThr/pTyr-binding forkhead associated (FHA) protein
VTAKVLWRDAQGIEGSIELGTQEIRVGRSMDCAIRTDDAMVSRHHARIVWAGAGYMVEDLGSANKVYYQEQVVQQHMLRHGDAVRCGSREGFSKKPSPQHSLGPPSHNVRIAGASPSV